MAGRKADGPSEQQSGLTSSVRTPDPPFHLGPDQFCIGSKMVGSEQAVVVAVKRHGADFRAVRAPAQVLRQVGNRLFFCSEQEDGAVEVAQCLTDEGTTAQVLKQETPEAMRRCSAEDFANRLDGRAHGFGQAGGNQQSARGIGPDPPGARRRVTVAGPQAGTPESSG